MNKPTIFFDFDGPIVDNRYKYHALHCDVLAELGCAAHWDLEAYWEAKRSRTSEWEILRSIGAFELAQEYEKRRLARIEDPRYVGLDRPWPGITQHLTSLARDFDLCLLSLRKRQSELSNQLRSLGLGHIFSQVLCENANDGSVEVKVRLARELTSGREDQCCFVGDTELDVQAGKALGIVTIGVSSGIRSLADLKAAQPDLLIKSTLELSPVIVRWVLDHNAPSKNIQMFARAASIS
jgi:phosphoglycolate phosphatase